MPPYRDNKALPTHTLTLPDTLFSTFWLFPSFLLKINAFLMRYEIWKGRNFFCQKAGANRALDFVRLERRRPSVRKAMVQLKTDLAQNEHGFLYVRLNSVYTTSVFFLSVLYSYTKVCVSVMSLVNHCHMFNLKHRVWIKINLFSESL